MSEQNGDKRYPASERRRQKAREEGQVVKSQDLASAAMLLAALGVLSHFGRGMIDQVVGVLVNSLRDPNLEAMTVIGASSFLVRMGYILMMAVAPILASMFVCAILVNLLQTGPMFTPEKLMPKFDNVNPLKGIKRLVALPNVMRLAFGVFKLMVIAAVATASLMRWQSVVMSLAHTSVAQVAKLIFDATFSTCLWIGSALFILALFDFTFQWWKHEQDLMMTEQEMRDEVKEMEGDPQVAARRKQVQRQLAMQRMNTDVPKADVVITNPTELAIAIQYDPMVMPAPVVLAKGAGVVAQRIRRLALENGIAIVERKPLAQFLYKAVEVGQAVPVEQYQAVAEVLRYVYQLEGREMPEVAA